MAQNMRLVVFGDLHIKASGKRPSYDNLSVPSDTDGIIIVGDVVHQTDPDDIAAGQEFYAVLAESDIPVWTIPGNHDPMADHREMAAPFDSVTLVHEDVVSIDEVDLVGWGCEALQVEMSVTPRAFDALDPRQQSGNRRYLADRVAEQLEDALYQYVQMGRSKTELIEQLDIAPDERAQFTEQLTAFNDRYATIKRLLTDAGSRCIVATHIPPYGTGVDRHHSIGERKANMQELHQGSIALKIALRTTEVAVVLCGHSHEAGYEILNDADSAHLFNPGFQGIATVEYSPIAASFSFEYHTPRR